MEPPGAPEDVPPILVSDYVRLTASEERRPPWVVDDFLSTQLVSREAFENEYLVAINNCMEALVNPRLPLHGPDPLPKLILRVHGDVDVGSYRRGSSETSWLESPSARAMTRWISSHGHGRSGLLRPDSIVSLRTDHRNVSSWLISLVAEAKVDRRGPNGQPVPDDDDSQMLATSEMRTEIITCRLFRVATAKALIYLHIANEVFGTFFGYVLIHDRFSRIVRVSDGVYAIECAEVFADQPHQSPAQRIPAHIFLNSDASERCLAHTMGTSTSSDGFGVLLNFYVAAIELLRNQQVDLNFPLPRLRYDPSVIETLRTREVSLSDEHELYNTLKIARPHPGLSPFSSLESSRTPTSSSRSSKRKSGDAGGDGPAKNTRSSAAVTGRVGLRSQVQKQPSGREGGPHVSSRALNRLATAALLGSMEQTMDDHAHRPSENPRLRLARLTHSRTTSNDLHPGPQDRVLAWVTRSKHASDLPLSTNIQPNSNDLPEDLARELIPLTTANLASLDASCKRVEYDSEDSDYARPVKLPMETWMQLLAHLSIAVLPVTVGEMDRLVDAARNGQAALSQ